MHEFIFSAMPDEELFEQLFVAEDRLELEAVQEVARRESLAPLLAQLVMDKQSWLAELPDWWAVVHATYILGLRGGDEAVLPLLTALRWADAFDCDWVSELLPSIFGSLGPRAMPGLTAVVRDASAGWSARDLALKGLAAITLRHPDTGDHVFRIIGERFMDDGENRVVRQLAGQILLDFRRADYRMALLKFAREEWTYERDGWYLASFGPEDVEWCFRNATPEVWHYEEDWMRFYDPGEVQRRQKRWARERLGARRPGGGQFPLDGGGRVLPLWRGKPGQPGQGPDSPDGEE